MAFGKIGRVGSGSAFYPRTKGRRAKQARGRSSQSPGIALGRASVSGPPAGRIKNVQSPGAAIGRASVSAGRRGNLGRRGISLPTYPSLGRQGRGGGHVQGAPSPRRTRTG